MADCQLRSSCPGKFLVAVTRWADHRYARQAIDSRLQRLDRQVRIDLSPYASSANVSEYPIHYCLGNASANKVCSGTVTEAVKAHRWRYAKLCTKLPKELAEKAPSLAFSFRQHWPEAPLRD